MDEAADADDELAQLQALWKTYSKLDKENELMVNGLIHECDRLLRNEDKNARQLPDFFHAIYALSLAELAKFKPDETKQCFDAAMERIDAGLILHSHSPALHFAKSRVVVAKIPLQYISVLDDEATIGEIPDIYQLWKDANKSWEKAVKDSTSAGGVEDNVDFLFAVDDMLDMIDNFGDDDDDDEDGADDSDEENDYNHSPHAKKSIQQDASGAKKEAVRSGHPLYEMINETTRNKAWWRKQTQQFLQDADKDRLALGTRRELCARLGQYYLLLAEEPAAQYMEVKYNGEEDAELSPEDERELSQWATVAKEQFQNALDWFKLAQDDDEPDTWVNVAEAMISLGNVYDMESPEQEKWYLEAEAILVRANKATLGRYAEVLENLRG